MITAGGVLTLPDTGLNEGADSLTITATDIIDSDRAVTLGAGTLTLNTQTAGGSSTFNTTVTNLTMNNSGTNDIIVNETDGLNLAALSASADTSINTGGTLTIPDVGLNVGAQRLSLSGTDIQDGSGRSLNFIADELSLDISNPTGDLVLNTDVTRLQSHLGAPANLTVIEADNMVLQDIESLGSAVDLSDGNFTLTADSITVNDAVIMQQGSMDMAASGNLTVNDNLQASDLVADGTREGMIDLSVDNGSLNVGVSGPVSIMSNNTSDQSASGGLGTEPSDQVSIRFRQLDSGTSPNNFSFGDGSGSDTVIQAVGGDIYIDSIGGGDDTLGNRQVNLNTDVTLTAFNNAGDAASGSLNTSNTNDLGANLIARAGRGIQINQVVAPAPTPDPEPEPEPPSLIEDVVSDLIGEEGSSSEPANDPLETSDPSIVDDIESDGSQVANTFSRAYQGCSDSDKQNNSSNCKVENVMVQFLSSFIIGGALPGANE